MKDKAQKQRCSVIHIDHTTGRKHKNSLEASKDLYIGMTGLFKRRKKYGNHFELDGHDIEVIPTSVHVKAKIIRCEDTGELFRSISEAARLTGGSYAGIYHAATTDHKYKGKRYRSLEGEEEFEAMCRFRIEE